MFRACVYPSILARPTDSQLKGTTHTNCCVCIYICIIPPDDGLQICPKHVKIDWRNKLRINTASCCFCLNEVFFPVYFGMPEIFCSDLIFWPNLDLSSTITGVQFNLSTTPYTTPCTTIHANISVE